MNSDLSLWIDIRAQKTPEVQGEISSLCPFFDRILAPISLPRVFNRNSPI